jgi:hypothetical protein
MMVVTKNGAEITDYFRARKFHRAR